jgi:hypothetical protein
MSIIRKIARLIVDKDYRTFTLANYGFFDHMNDKKYLEKVYKAIMKKRLNLDNPQSFNEKLQWLKLYNRRTEYTIMVDKYKVREYVANKIGQEYLIPLIGVWEDPDEINFENLPNQFVLKCNHNSGLGMCICKDKSKLDILKVKKELSAGLKENYYLHGREWPYKDVSRKIICEKYMTDESKTELKDYKLMCFDGKMFCCFVCSERFSSDGLKITFFDRNWNVLPFERHYPKSKKNIKKPQNYEKMIELAEILSKDIPFVRVDFYEVEGQIYFGELTFFPGSGFEEFQPESADIELGNLIKLPTFEADYNNLH